MPANLTYMHSLKYEMHFIPFLCIGVRASSVVPFEAFTSRQEKIESRNFTWYVT